MKTVLVSLTLLGASGAPALAADDSGVHERLDAAFESAWDSVQSGAHKAASAGDWMLEKTKDGGMVVWRDTKRGARAGGEALSDAAILSAIKTRLAADPDTSARAIDVDVDDGTVTLNGTVESDREAKTAM